MRLTLIALLLCSPLAFAQPKSIDKVNGSIRTESGVEYADLETVNGGITVDSGVLARDVSTVNGGIDIRDDAVVESVETVNGGIRIERKVTVRGDVETVNGGIRIDTGSQVGGGLETVNGGMRLVGATVERDLVTVNGSIEVGEGSLVNGGITVNKPSGFGWNWGKSKPPRITIGPNAVVKGELNFEREVELEIHPTAKTGAIRGVTPIRIGAEPVER